VDVARSARPKSRKALIAAVLGTVVLLGGLAVSWRSSASAGVPIVERNAVWTDRVRRADLLRQVLVQGTLVAERVQWLSAESAARIARIEVQPGELVESDTVVLVLENSELELAAHEAERQVASAQTTLIELDIRTGVEKKQQEASLIALRGQLRDARARAELAKKLAPNGLVSVVDYREAQNKAASLDRQVIAEAARLKILKTGRHRRLAALRREVSRLRDIAKFRRRQLAALEIRAGVRGVVQEIPLEHGQWVAVGTLLAKVAEPGRLKAEVKVAEAEAKDVRKGLPVRFEGPSGDFRGSVVRIDPKVIAGSVRLEIRLGDSLPKGLRADQSVTGYVEIERLENVLLVTRPTSAANGATLGLFRLEPDGVYASRVTARFGRGSAREIEVLGGLNEGDEIVVSDVSNWGSPRIRFR